MMTHGLIGQMVSIYRVDEYIGSGGQGIVYRGFDTNRNRPVALKCIRPEEMANTQAIERFRIEAEVNKRLRHPCIVPLYDFWRDDNSVWLVTAWLEGGNLRRLLRKKPLTLNNVVTMLMRVGAALDAVHAVEIIHRDIKPDNILFDASQHAYLTDFGAAKRLKVQPITQSGAMIGSPGYHAPEIIQHEAVTPQSDIFSLAIVAYEALTGEHPFENPNLLQRMMNVVQKPLPYVTDRCSVPIEVDHVLQKAAAKVPQDRYASAGEMARAFQQAARTL
jgi:serine/threonine protein kinase